MNSDPTKYVHIALKPPISKLIEGKKGAGKPLFLENHKAPG
jgi:hypothetical protein